MKKLLLSAALFAGFVGASYAQITLPPFETPTITGGSVIPVFQGANGNLTVQDILIPQVTGTFNSAEINASLTASSGDTYANDFAIVVTSGPDVANADILLQIGGYSNFTTNKIDWPCAPDCDSDVIGTIVSGEVTFTGLDFSATEYVIWIANGYVNANPPTNTGAWDVTSLTFGGISTGNASVESSAPVSAVAYPNPATDVLNVAVEGDEVVEIAILSLDGKTVASSEGSVAMVADLTAGMYIYVAKTATGAIIRETFMKK